MYIEFAAPASMPLGVLKLDHNGEPKTALLSISLQHPPVHISAQKSDRLSITGPRAHIASNYAELFFKRHDLPKTGLIEIESAIPGLMGLGSDGIMGISIARGLSSLHGLTSEDLSISKNPINLGVENLGEIWGCARGGFLLIDLEADDFETDPVLRRTELSRPEGEGWAIILYLPNPPDGAPDSYEASLLKRLVRTAPKMTHSSGKLITDGLWPAVEQDDIEAFGEILMGFQRKVRAGMDELGRSAVENLDDKAIFDLMRGEGASAWGRCLTGYGLWGLVRDGEASVVIQKKIQDHVGYYGGRVMATIVDNEGCRSVEQEGNLGMTNPMRPKPGVSGSES